jgi:pyrroloquinoline quinone biosynthesis protein A
VCAQSSWFVMFFNAFGTHQVFPHDGIDIACDSFAAGGVHAPPSSQTCFMPTYTGDFTMQWTTPAFTDLRFGFEITMYIANR